MQEIFDKIINWDYAAFYFVHIKCANSFFDFLMPYLRNPFFWSPVYLFLLAFMWHNFGKKGLQWAVYFLFTFATSDFLSASVLKPMFHRLRPCIDPMWLGIHRQIVSVSTGFSFPSSHATNHFAMAVFLIVTLRGTIRNLSIYALLWATIICFAQVYVGVHYPLDVIFGAILGTWVGYFIGNLCNLRHQF